jgi:signal transduction histidine kinase/CheY-like chemotaxis protein
MRQPDEDDELRASALASVPAVVLARQKLEQELRAAHAELEEEKRTLEVLNKTGMMLASNLELEALVQAVTDAGTSVCGARFGAFFYNVTNEQGDVFALYTLSGAPRSAFESFPHPRATPIFAPTFRGEAVIRSDDVMADPRYGQMGPYHGMPPGHLPVRSYLAVPVVLRSGEVVGGLFFGHEERAIFTERAERLVVGVAAQAAIAIDNARNYEAARRAAAARESVLEAERASRAEAERVIRLKDEFLTTLSHELRTPLNSVLGWAQVLLARHAEPELRRGLETIDRNARAQVQLIDDLLDMSRIISGKMRLDIQPVDLANVVASAVESVRPSADAKTIALRPAIDPNAGAVMGDPDRLQQVVWNLLSNAVKFTPRKGKIDVVLQRAGSSIEVVVRDNGAGIDATFLPHVFERFTQADASSTRRHGGLGIGLSIVKHLVELHGGTIRVESAEGEGATFTLTLPLRAVATPGREHPRGHVDSDPSLDVSLLGLRVLVVDDDADARDLLRTVLSGADAEVDLVESADEALRHLALHVPDVIVSDIGMPSKDGYQLMREVRALSAAAGGRTPAIALTAFARAQDRTRALVAGYQMHIAKPIEPQELVAAIRSLAEHRGERARSDGRPTPAS